MIFFVLIDKIEISRNTNIRKIQKNKKTKKQKNKKTKKQKNKKTKKTPTVVDIPNQMQFHSGIRSGSCFQNFLGYDL